MTQINGNVNLDALLSLARGSYQRGLLTGEHTWSGSDLRGKAREYSSRYAASRAGLLERIRAAGYAVTVSYGERGRKIVTISAAPSEEVAYGYTLAEWLAAAGRTDTASMYDLRAAWSAGEDPGAYRMPMAAVAA